MGVRVLTADAASFVVEAPLALNHNHLGTGFGGSIQSVATLAGYGLLWLEMRDATKQIVIAESTMRFLRPVRETIRAVCARPRQSEMEAFHSALNETGKARLKLSVAVIENNIAAAKFEGTFVALDANA